MSGTIDAALTDRISALLAEIGAVEAARPPIEQEVQDELGRLDALTARSDLTSSLWLAGNPNFTTAAFDDSVTAVLLLVAPDQARKALAERTRRRAAAWRGLRLGKPEKAKRLTKARNDLRVARARLEVRRREIEQQTGEMQPRVGDDPAVWLLPQPELDALAATANGRAR